MAQRRLIYLTALLGGVVFYLAYREWLSGFLLACILLIPLLSLVLSLPAVYTAKVQMQCPRAVNQGTAAEVSFGISGRLPFPGLETKLRFVRVLAGRKKRTIYKNQLPTGHCGALRLTPCVLWARDYLGLLRIPKGKLPGRTVLVRPIPVKPVQIPDINRHLSNAYRPKNGGFAENHELRLYRPGDDLRQIHWKLSGKTGKLILREPLTIAPGMALLTLELRGTPAELDRKLGTLLWMSRYLLEHDIPHRIQCMTGKGMQIFQVSNETEAQAAVDALLQSPAASENAVCAFARASWRYHIGGDGHES